MILEQKVKIRLRPSNMKHFQQLGYDVMYDKIIEIDVNDLSKTSRVKVQCKCDFCDKEFQRPYINVYNSEYHTCGNEKCKDLLRKQTNLKCFGYENPMFNKTIAKTLGKNFANNYGRNSVIHNEFIEKRNNTNLIKHGNKRGYINKDSNSKRINTLFENFDNAKCRKGVKKPTSKMQVYICELLDGILNYEIVINQKRYFGDIVLKDEKIIIEYDGIGHDLFRTRCNNQLSNIDYTRDKELSDNGWKIIHLYCNNYSCPKGNDLIDLINQCKSKHYKSFTYDTIKQQFIVHIGDNDDSN